MRHYYAYDEQTGFHSFLCRDCRDSYVFMGLQAGLKRESLTVKELGFNPNDKPALFHRHVKCGDYMEPQP